MNNELKRRDLITESLENACNDLSAIELRNKIHFDLIHRGHDEAKQSAIERIEKEPRSIEIKWKAPYKKPFAFNKTN